MIVIQILAALAHHGARCYLTPEGGLLVDTPRPLPVWLDALLQLHWPAVAAAVAEQQQRKSY